MSANGCSVGAGQHDHGLMSRPTVISLYSGAGGLDLGFIDAGFDVVWANDIDRHAVKTYNANVGPHAVCGDVVRMPVPDVTPDVVIGGPPCQGFSVIGRMRSDDPRSQHVTHFLDVVEDQRPRAFVMENVKALGANPRWAPLREQLRERAKQLGYATRLMILNAADHDVPQARERMFLVGVLGNARVDEPEASSGHRPPTVRDALALLPHFGEPGNDTVTGARVVPSRDPVMRPTAHRGSLLFNGSGRPLDLDQPAKTLPASMGGNATPIIDQDELDHGADPWVVGYHQHLAGGGKPLKVAPKRLRRLTVEECAVLQSFPVGFRFHGPRVAQYRQVGNAVPPRLAYVVATAVHEALVAAPLSIAA
jgi:DNA (cytosine-5)-methyltransferase 1